MQNTSNIEEFNLDIRFVDGEWHVHGYDRDNGWQGTAMGDDIGNCLHHIIYAMNPVIAAQCWPNDYLDWHEAHDIDYDG